MLWLFNHSSHSNCWGVSSRGFKGVALEDFVCLLKVTRLYLTFLFPFVFQIISLLFSLAFWKITFDKLFRSFCHVWHITIGFHGFRCRNLNIRFTIQCGVQRPMSQKNVFVCETNFHKWGKVQEMEPNDFQVHSHFGSPKCLEPWFKKKKNTKLDLQDTLGKVLKCECLHIVHLNLICMSYDQKKGRESNWEFDS